MEFDEYSTDEYGPDYRWVQYWLQMSTVLITDECSTDECSTDVYGTDYWWVQYWLYILLL